MEIPETTEKSIQSSVVFLLKEYEECWAQARHIDEYMERMPRFFLIVVGAVTAAIAALIRFSELTSLTFVVGGIGLIILALVGFFASLTIPRYRVIRTSYFNAIYLIHKYFADKEEDLKKYIGLQIGGTFKGYLNPFRVDFFRYMMMVIMDSSLMAAGLYSLQNSQALASQLTVALEFSWTVIGGTVFFGLHICVYFLLILCYMPKQQESEDTKEAKKVTHGTA